MLGGTGRAVSRLLPCVVAGSAVASAHADAGAVAWAVAP